MISHIVTPIRVIRRRGLTLLELLVAMAVIAMLASLAVPAWSAISRGRSGEAAASMVLDLLERGRTEAIASKRGAWVLFLHAGPGGRDCLRIVEIREGKARAEGPWRNLPPGIFFGAGEETLLSVAPTPEVEETARVPGAPDRGEKMGGILFGPSGGVVLPPRGGSRLLLRLTDGSGKTIRDIHVSRASGRASCR
jgi:prepilin-type N-terminal cleavage/methylation domain-containing protein